MKIRYIFLLVFFSSFCFSQELSFFEAWNKVLQRNDTLKAKKEDLLSAQFRQKAARDLYLPDISISAIYTHLEKPIEFSGKSLFKNSKNENSIKTIVGGIAKGSSSAVYSESLQKGKSQLEALTLAKKNANEILSSVANIQNSIKNSSFELVKQDNVSSSLSAIWPLYTGGKRKAAQIVASGEIDETLAIIELAKLEQFENLAKIYFSVDLLEDVYKTKKQAVETFGKHYNQAVKLEKYGQIAKIQRLSAKVSLDKAKIEANKTQKQLEIAKIALAQILHEKEVKTSTKLFVNNKIDKLEVFKQKTLSSYPAFALLDAKKKKTKALILAKKSAYHPNVFLFGSYNVYREKTPNSKNMPDWFAGLGVNYKLFDSKGRSGQLDSAYAMKRKVEFTKNQMIRDISVLVEKTYKEVLLAKEEYEGLSSSVQLGYENVRLHEKSFTQGISTSMNVVDAQLSLQTIQTQRAVASYNYVLAFTKLLALSKQIDTFSKYK